MSCRSTQSLLPLFVEGDLPGRKASRVQRHLAGCDLCRGIADQFRQSQTWLHTAPGPAVTGAALERMRRAVWRRIDVEPRPAGWRLAIERGWAALRHWTSQPLFAAVAVMVVVVGSVGVTRLEGMGGSRLDGVLTRSDQTAAEVSGDEPEPTDDPEMVLAQATPDELSDSTDPGEGEATDERANDNMRIEIQTQDPNVRIIWFTPAASEPTSVED